MSNDPVFKSRRTIRRGRGWEEVEVILQDGAAEPAKAEIIKYADWGNGHFGGIVQRMGPGDRTFNVTVYTD